MTKKCCPMLCSCARILLLLLQKVVIVDTTFLISIEECTKKIINKKDLMKDLLAKTGRRKI